MFYFCYTVIFHYCSRHLLKALHLNHYLLSAVPRGTMKLWWTVGLENSALRTSTCFSYTSTFACKLTVLPDVVQNLTVFSMFNSKNISNTTEIQQQTMTEFYWHVDTHCCTFLRTQGWRFEPKCKNLNSLLHKTSVFILSVHYLSILL